MAAVEEYQYHPWAPPFGAHPPTTPHHGHGHLNGNTTPAPAPAGSFSHDSDQAHFFTPYSQPTPPTQTPHHIETQVHNHPTTTGNTSPPPLSSGTTYAPSLSSTASSSSTTGMSSALPITPLSGNVGAVGVGMGVGVGFGVGMGFGATAATGTTTGFAFPAPFPTGDFNFECSVQQQQQQQQQSQHGYGGGYDYGYVQPQPPSQLQSQSQEYTQQQQQRQQPQHPPSRPTPPVPSSLPRLQLSPHRSQKSSPQTTTNNTYTHPTTSLNANTHTHTHTHTPPTTITSTTTLPNGVNLPTTTTSEQKAPVLSLSTIARQIASNAAAQRSLAPRGRGRGRGQAQVQVQSHVQLGQQQVQGQGQVNVDMRQQQQQQQQRGEYAYMSGVNGNGNAGSYMQQGPAQAQDFTMGETALLPTSSSSSTTTTTTRTPPDLSSPGSGLGSGSGSTASPPLPIAVSHAHAHARTSNAINANAAPSHSPVPMPSLATLPGGTTSTMAATTIPRRPNGACTRCKKMKMKCTFPSPTAPTCLRCLTSNVPLATQPCTVEGRKPRTPSQREALLAQIREKDAVIAKLVGPWVREREEVGGFGGSGGGGAGAGAGAGAGGEGTGGAAGGTSGGGGVVLAGGKIVAALEGAAGASAATTGVGAAATANGKRGMSLSFAQRGEGSNGGAPPPRSRTLPVLGPTERAALMSVEKGGTGSGSGSGAGSGAGTTGFLGGGFGKRGFTGAVKKEGKAGGVGAGTGEDSDEEWSSGDESGEGDDAWDEEVERRWGEVDPSFVPGSAVQSPNSPNADADANSGRREASATPSLPIKPLPTSGQLQLVSLPPRHSPLGLIARLSLEEGGVRGVGSTTGSVFGKSVIAAGIKREDSMTPSTPSFVSSPLSAGGRSVGTTISSSFTSTPSSLRKRLFPPSLDDSENEDDKGDADSDDDEDDDWLEESRGEEPYGIASPEYFHPGPGANLALRRVLNARGAPPPILATGLVNWEEVQELFDIFFTKISVFVSLLDESLHSPQSTLERDPFLFTVVCAISSRYLESRPNLHLVAMHFAKTAAASALISGTKSIEMAQAYLLLTVYGLPARRWEEDRAWFYGGLASRIATDLALSRTSSSSSGDSAGGSSFSVAAVARGGGDSGVFLGERHAREKLNRIRTWLNCWNVDRSSSTQFGKPTGLEEEDVVKRATEVAGGKGWWRSSEWNHRYDVHMVWYTELLRVMSRFHERVYGVKGKNRDLRAITEMTEQELSVWHDRATESYARDSDPSDSACVFRARGLTLFENYMRLVMYSFGFEEAWKKRGSLEPGDMFFAKCLQCATGVLGQLSEYAPSGYLKYAPDCYFVMGGFSGAFLLKMLRPEFSALIDSMIRARIIGQIERFVGVLASKDAAINETHTPMLYAKFLHTQLKRVLQPQEKKEESQKEVVSQQQQQQVGTPRPRTFKQEEPEMQLGSGTQESELGSGAATPRNNRNAALPTMELVDRNTPTPGIYSSAQTPSGYSSVYSTSVQTPGVPALDTNFDWTTLTNSYTSNDWSSNGLIAGMEGDYYATGAGAGASTQGASAEGDGYDAMELCDEDFLATMQAVSSEQWLNSVLMPGFRWPSPVSSSGMMDMEIVGSPVQQQQQQQQGMSPSPVQQQQQYDMPMWN